MNQGVQASALSGTRTAVLFLVLLTLPVSQGGQFRDYPGSYGGEFGRTVNGVSALVVAAITRQIAPHKSVEASIDKRFWPDAKILGVHQGDQTVTNVDLTLTSATATLENGGGKVEKSEYDWQVAQESPSEWNIVRAPGKLDHTLKLIMKDGVISGALIKKMNINWKIDGTYDSDRFSIQVETGWTEPNFSISGEFK